MQDQNQPGQRDIDQQSTPDPQSQVEVPPAPDNNMISKDEMEGLIKVRLRHERQKAEETQKEADRLAKELDALKKKFESGKATTNEAADYVTTSNLIDKAQVKGIDPSEIPAIIADHLKLQKLDQNLKETAEKDKEFKTLINAPDASSKISEQEFMTFKEYDNPSAILKHLLKDDADRLVYKACQEAYANGDGGVKYWEFLGNLSKKLKSTAVYPHPSNFKPFPSLTDVGEHEEFNVSSYIREKYK